MDAAAKRLRAGGFLLVASCAAACASPRDDGRTATLAQAATASPAAVMSFDVASLWHPVTGTVSASTLRVEGAYSLAVTGGGWRELWSSPMTKPAALSSSLAFELRLPPQQPNPWWHGQAQLHLDAPSAGIFRQYLGAVELTGKPLERFFTVEVPLPQWIHDALASHPVNDLRFGVVLNLPYNATGTYRLDHLRFVGVDLCVGVDPSDGNPCTTDACIPATGAVTHTPVADGSPCADADLCNGAETCLAGDCTAGTPPVVDDGNACTDDACDPATGVTHLALADGTPCPDADLCNGAETCLAGACAAGTPPVVDDGNVCTADACDPASGVTHVAVANGTLCADADLCNGDELCLAGACAAGTPPALDDGNVCTADACDPATGVTHLAVADGSPCPDANLCNGAESCQSGDCTAGTPPAVDDANVCTADACDPATGVTHLALADGTPCPDATLCNGDESCLSGSCTPGTPPVLDDGNACTADACDPATGVTHLALADGSPCPDADLCNGDESCQSGSCASGTAPVLDDGNVCTADACDPARGVTHLALADGSPCPDADLCNGAESCQTGSCTPGTPPAVDDGNVCTADACDPATGVTHVAVADGTACLDADLCNGNESCLAGSCTAGTPPSLDDGNVCTTDACDPTTGVTHLAVADGTACLDADACNGSETCLAGACTAGTPPTLDDGNVCTTDACDPATGVTHVALADGSPCPDADACNGAESCLAGACAAGEPLVVDDGNPCTADACDPATGVTHLAAADGSPCPDADVCNGDETCLAGDCQFGTPLDPDDGNPCTIDACEPLLGVTRLPAPPGTNCADENPCNGTETCDGAGLCAPSAPPSLDDENPCTLDTCDPIAGVTHTPLPTGTSCSNGDACDGEETCSETGECASVPVLVDDRNPCTVDHCDATTGEVTHDPMPAGTPCDACGGVCDEDGACRVETPVVSDDGNPCTIELCDPVTGVRVSTCSTLDRTTATNVFEATSWLYSGASPVQVGLEPEAIEVERAAVVRGYVADAAGTPLPGVTVDVLWHPEYGETVTQANGSFDLAVNGGELLMLRYRRATTLEVQRPVTVSMNDYTLAPDVVLVALDPVVTAIDLGASDSFQVARGSPESDTDGERQATLLVPPGTEADLVLEDGSIVPAPTLALRLTEYTVGEIGPGAMPGTLPSATRYTYAFEISADEAIAAGARSVELTQSVPVYVENFIGFPVGEAVPVGSYDRTRGLWVPEPSGRVIEIVDEVAGYARVDVTGDGAPDTGAPLAALGITDAELEQLAALYQPGQSLWRFMTDHFTPWDCNWGGSPPDDAIPPPLPDPSPDDDGLEDPCLASGSIIDCESQTLRERVPIAGTPYSLNFSSERSAARAISRGITITLSGPSVPESARAMVVEVDVAGRHFEERLAPEPNRTFHFVWDGKDAYGRLIQGRTTANVRTAFEYSMNYGRTSSFASSPDVTIVGNRSLSIVQLERRATAQLGRFVATPLGLGGLTLDVHHALDTTARAIEFGTGERLSASTLAPSQERLFTGYLRALERDGAGGYYYFLSINNDTQLFHRQRGGAASLLLSFGRSVPIGGLARAPDGSLYFSMDPTSGTVLQSHHVIRFDPATGEQVHVAGSGSSHFRGDGGPALQASVGSVADMAVAPDGTLYIASPGHGRVRKVTPDGVITTFAGNGTARPEVDGKATQSALADPGSVAVAPDGSVYIAEASTVIYSGSVRFGHVRRVTPDGNIRTIPGVNCPDRCGALSAAHPHSLDVAPDGSLYIVTADGYLLSLPADGGTAVELARVTSFAKVVTADDGSPSTCDGDGLLHLGPALPALSATALLVPSSDGSEVFIFSGSGRHLNTLNAVTGTTLRMFGYDTAGRVTSVTDATGNVTRVEHAANGTPTAIVAPHGQTTSLVLDASGRLVALTNPLGDTITLGYDARGMLTSFENQAGHSSSFLYDGLGLLTRDTDASGGFKALDRETFGNGWRTTLTTALGVSRSYDIRHDQLGGLTRTNTFSDGTVATVTRGTMGTSATTQPDGTVVTTTRADDPLWGQVTPMTREVARLPSGLERVVERTRTATIAPPSLVRLGSETVSRIVNGRTTTSTYNGSTRVYSMRTPAGRTSTRTLDELGRTVRIQVGTLRPTTFQYDGEGRLIATAQGTRTTARTYHPTGAIAGYLESATDPLGTTTTYVPDPLGRTLTETTSDAATTFAWDLVSNLIGVTPPGKPPHAQAYTPVNLLETYAPPPAGLPAPATSYEYDLDRNLTATHRPDGIDVTRNYDQAGRLDRVMTPTGTTEYAYYAPDCAPLPGCAPGRVASVSGPDAVTLAFTYDGPLTTSTTWTGDVNGAVAWTHDNDFRPVTEAVTDGTTTSTVTLGYDADSLLTCASPTTCATSDTARETLTYNTHALLTQATLGSTTATCAYNTYGELASHAVRHGSTTVYNVVYDATGAARDNLGRVTRKTETLQGTARVSQYAYDALGRLTEVREDGTLTEQYEYDSNGNRLSMTTPEGTIDADYDDQDRLLRYGTLEYAYTANGDLASKLDTVTDEHTAYEYDARGNLLRVDLPDGTVVEYLVDGRNRRIARLVNGAVTQRWLYRDALNPVAELDAAGTLTWQYVYGSKPNTPDYAIRVADGARYRIVSDQLGSVVLVVNVDEAADVLFAGRYSAFGEQEVISGDPGWGAFGFAGGRYDAETGLVRFGARDYDSETGRWTRKDPITWRGGQGNLYVYAGNNPVGGTDASGLAVYVCYDLTGQYWWYDWVGFDHAFIHSTSGGSWGANPWLYPGDTFPTNRVIDESGFYEGLPFHSPNIDCREVPDIDETCVNQRLNDHDTGGYYPLFNDCRTWALSVVDACSYMGGAEGASNASY